MGEVEEEARLEFACKREGGLERMRAAAFAQACRQVTASYGEVDRQMRCNPPHRKRPVVSEQLLLRSQSGVSILK